MPRDVAIVGGGASGLSAAVFVARYGLDTVVLDGGVSAIRQCVHLENFLGFPGGISPDTFLELGREQATLEGCTVRDSMVLDVERTDDGFRIDAQGEEEPVEATRVIAASLYDDNYLSDFEDELTDVDRDGRTPVEGLYMTGCLGDESEHQAIVNAGDGARTALSLIRDVRREDEELWDGIADHYYDWTVQPGRYSGPKWEESMDSLVAESAPEDATDAELADLKERLKREYRSLELDEEERAARAERGRELLRTHLLEEKSR
ncbi:Thioredoxin reductase-like protein [Haladaptatus paucihalophilus DX253]|uniref:Pyridine nucleotide-disulphide oxidoreductase n=1 Tax=Haladaptatus paucihalophilus DX253 TaxID=797209 RepID=E7QV48_HALPU|nr:NAD(P)/FAD-dependent oxidoreductase [Haladaptatus paucihalophilus]EFW91566.1 Thioredoxin reductase-like protein [Haladaptatus paucihalophilus DX253]SHL24438.1 Pyridine nucleotide-disulphide oxidoreductase [Haladaptatus paucihalophilus DX253]